MAAAASRGARRHVPQRLCVACRRTGDKRSFVRIVRTPEGAVRVDPDGRAPGRGAYLCREPACWDAALRSSRLAGALRTAITEADRSALLAHAATLAPAGAAIALDEGDGS